MPMLPCQKHLFTLPDDITYLNGAYMAPQLKSVEAAGHENVSRKNNPVNIPSTEFFNQRMVLKQRFANLVQAEDYQNIALIPSVSYGMANVANNVKLRKGDEILVINDQFPSNIYIWQKTAAKYGAIIKSVAPPPSFRERGKLWNQAILDAIGPKTALVAMGHVHWADGTLFDLKAIRGKNPAIQSPAHHRRYAERRRPALLRKRDPARCAYLRRVQMAHGFLCHGCSLLR